jgi:hypothetical protein
MRWEDKLLAFLDDLEQQADGLALVERDTEVAELARAEYARLDLVARLHASVGHRVTCGLPGDVVTGRLSRVGRDWCLLAGEGIDWVVRLAAVGYLRGVSDRAVAEPARPLSARLGLGSALRGLAEAQAPVVVRRTDGGHCTGVLGRVGADFVEVLGWDESGAGPRGPGTVLVPFTGLVAAGGR